MLDLRWPMGMMFALVGAILAVYGLATYSSPMYHERSQDININLWWGLVLMVFGAAMLGLAKMAADRAKSSDGEPK